MGHDERRPAGLLDHLGDGERLAAPGHAQQHLVLLPLLHAPHKPADRLPLVAPRPVIDPEPVNAHLRPACALNSQPRIAVSASKYIHTQSAMAAPMLPYNTL
jgi:hypothetical protein